MKRIDQVLVRPLLTEKVSADMDEKNTYAFEVGREATKLEVKQAIERLFSVRVKDVRTLVVRGKVKRFGRHFGKRSNWKKAYVTLHEGEELSAFTGI